MKGSDIENGFKVIGYEIRDFYSKNKAHIFTGLGIGGTIATGILSAKAGAKCARKIDKRRRELDRDLTFGEKAQLCWTDAILPISACALACFSDFKSDQINTKMIADRTTLLIASEQAYEKLSQKTRDVLGEKKAKQIRDEIVKEDVLQPGVITQEKLDNAPKTGNGKMYPFMDGYTGLLFWSNIDYLRCCELKLREMMSEIAPRNADYDYDDRKVGVPYSEWLSFLGFDRKVYSTQERKDIGWNKGFDKNGLDDDPIEFYTSAVEWEPGFAVTVIDWSKDPSDMKLGRLRKTSGL